MSSRPGLAPSLPQLGVVVAMPRRRGFSPLCYFTAGFVSATAIAVFVQLCFWW